MTEIHRTAQDFLESLEKRQPRKPDPSLSSREAYRIVAAILDLRKRRGEKSVGRKIGFTNSGIWEHYGISDPIWGYMYDTTVNRADAVPAVSVSNFLEPRIEPEICFGLHSAPSPEMDETSLMDCIAWVANGFEIVQSLYPGWKLGVADAIAGHGMHGLYVLGKRHEISPADRNKWLSQLPGFEVDLVCNNEAIDRGTGSNVLGGPLSALRHLVDLLARDSDNPPLAAGEIVTTGSLTGAFPVKAGEIWSTTIDGLPVEGLSIRIE